MVVIPRKKDVGNKHIITQIHNYVNIKYGIFFVLFCVYIDELLFGKISVS